MLKVLFFLNYYVQKRLSVLFKLHHTANPLTMRWRWNHFIHHYERQKRSGIMDYSASKGFFKNTAKANLRGFENAGGYA